MVYRRRPLPLALLLLPLFASLAAPSARGQVGAPYTHITLTQMLDSGTPVVSAKLCATPADQYGNPINVSSNTVGFIVKGAQFCQTITNGVLAASFAVPNACATNNPNPIYYNFSIQELDGSGNPSGVPIVIPAVPNVCGITYALDQYAPVASSSASLSPPLAQGVGVPSTCTAPSIWLNTSTPALYFCEGGSYVSVSLAGPTGPPGEVTTAALNAAIAPLATTAALNAAVNPLSLEINGTPSLNLFDYTAVTAGSVVNSSTGAAVPGYSGFTLTDYMNVTGGTQFVSNGNIGVYAPIPAGVAFYTGTKAAPVFLSGYTPATNPIPAGTAVPIPSGATLMRLYFEDAKQTLGYNQIMVCLGTSCPSSYVAFGNTGGVLPQISAANATASAAQAAVTAQVPIAATQLAASLPLNNNLLDQNRLVPGKVSYYPGGAYAGNIPTFATGISGYTGTSGIPVQGRSYVASNLPLHANASYGPVFTDASGNLLAATGNLLTYVAATNGIPAGTSIAVPSNAAFYYPYLNVSASGSGNNAPQGSTANWMVVTSDTSPVAFPSSYQPFLGQGYQKLPLSGVNTCWLGDSISYGQGSGLPLSPLVAAITGGTDYYSLAWSGRRMYDALDNTGNTGVAFPTSSTIANCKVLVLWLSTNFDGSAGGNIGSIGDTASVGTSNANGITFPSTDSYVANAKGVLNQLYAWNPALRIILVGPYQSAIRNAPNGCTGYGAGVVPCAAGLANLYSVVQINAQIGSLYSVPVFDAYDEIGLNTLNSATMTVDGVHPTASTQQYLIAPYLAHKIAAYAPQ